MSKKSSTFALGFKNEANINIGAVVQLVRIHACHAWGRGFESRPHRKKKQKCFFFCYILPTCYQLWVLDGFITGSYPTFPVTTPIPLRYHSEPLPKEERSVVVPLWLRTLNSFSLIPP